MSRINQLDSVTANKIKAGEVIERPVSVVKELFDNSIDAGASEIKIEFKNGGITLIRVTDNGIGMDSEDARKAFLLHATSKITCIDDIYDLTTQGFRGEALSSIAACSKVTLVTKTADSNYGTMVEYQDGKLISTSECSATVGTTISVSDLFENIPARYKFLKKDSTEGMYICSMVEKLAIVNPHVSVKLIKDGKVILSTPGNGVLLDAIYSVYGKEIAKELIPVNYEFEGSKIRGYISRPEYTRGNKALQCFFVNERIIRNLAISKALEEAYRNILMKNRYSICFLSIFTSPNKVDVNVHPQKCEVRFTSESDIYRLVYHGVEDALISLRSNIPVTSVDSISATSNISGIKYKANYLPAPTQLKYNQASISEGNSSTTSTTNNASKACTNILEILSNLDYKPSDYDYKKEDSTTITPIIEDSIEFKKTDIGLLLESRFIGVLFNTFIIMQAKDYVFFIDQHAAHERVLYESFLLTKTKNDNNLSQALLVPKIISFSASDYSFIQDRVSDFSSHGFDIELLENREVAIRQVPYSYQNIDLKLSIETIINEFKNDLPMGNDRWFASIASAACKAAIKAHDRIDEQEVISLINQLSKLKDPYHCPHGRPTFIRQSISDFEKMFKRIV